MREIYSKQNCQITSKIMNVLLPKYELPPEWIPANLVIFQFVKMNREVLL